MTEPQTCGQGLAANSTLPSKLGAVMAGVAAALEAHMKALDIDDPDAKREHDAYRSLVDQDRRAAAQLLAIGQEMAGYRDLPMGPHDPELASSPEFVDAFERLVQAERALLALMQERVGEDETMLSAMR
jgi:hypothetical protein